MFDIGEIVDGKYRVDRVCSDSGGMGAILHVTQLIDPPEYPLVLKYCRKPDEEHLKRFRREVRLLNEFSGNSKVVQIEDKNLSADPPYFVMRFYADGDLSNIATELQISYALQEQYFLKMIDCIQELHARNEFHRDIKPQNFLREGELLVVSDLGLSTELLSATAFTSSSAGWGTPGYIPPEFLHGGFKHADAAGDIYMLGKTFYVLLTGREPSYLMQDDVPPPLFHIITRCCNLPKVSRYQTLAELKESLVASYDVLLNRAGGVLQEMFSAIRDRLATTNRFNANEVSRFVEQLALADAEDQSQVIRELPEMFFSAISQKPLANSLTAFLSIYENYVDGASYTWAHAETIANRMNFVFKTRTVPAETRALALDLAIRAAYHMNRYAAMDSCKAMVKTISEEDLALNVVPIIFKEEAAFLSDLEPSNCSNEAIRNAIRTIRNKQQ